MEISRRRFLGGSVLLPVGVAGVSTACGAESQPSVIFSENSDTEIKNEVSRLAQKLPPDSIARKVYTGFLTQVNSLFKSALEVNPNTEKGFALMRTRVVDTPNNRFTYHAKVEGGFPEPNPTIEKVDIAILFSKNWLQAKSDRVKLLAMQKEAMNAALWESIALVAYASLVADQVKIEKLDSSVTDREIQLAIGNKYVANTPDFKKLADYAGYLAVMPEVDKMMRSTDAQAKSELDQYTDVVSVYQRAKVRGVRFDLPINSRDFLGTAFDRKSAWVQIISDPSVGSGDY